MGHRSVFGTKHMILRRVMPEPRASLVFEDTLMLATFALFPLLGRTPRDWRWPFTSLRLAPAPTSSTWVRP
jgi:hypothetical protein